MKKLYRIKKDKKWSGVFTGLGEYFGIDPVLLRVLFVLVLFVTGVVPALLAYFVAIFIIPLKN